MVRSQSNSQGLSTKPDNEWMNEWGFNVRFLTRRRCQGRPRRDVQLQIASNHQNTPANTHAERESEIQTVQVRYPRQEDLIEQI